MQCLECGVWYRGLGQHVRLKHGMDPEDYRRDHQLPRSLALWPEDLRAEAAERSAVNLARPEHRAAFDAGRPPREEILRRSAAAMADSVGRAAVIQARREASARGGRSRRERLAREWDDRARALGHADMAAFLNATRTLTNAGVAAQLGTTKGIVGALRRRYDIPPPGFAATDRRQVTHRRRADPYRTPPGQRPIAPPGVQPESGGRVQCLDCGRWYRLLGNHLRLTHGMSVDDYQEEFELPASRGLVPEDLRETMAEHGRHLFATNDRVREALTRGSAEVHLHREANLAARAATVGRAGVQAALRESARRSAEKRAKDLRADKDARARAVGYSDLVDFLQRTAHLPTEEVGRILGETGTQIGKLRRKHGVPSLGRDHLTAERRAERARALRPPDVPRGLQPAADGRLQCLECGRWYRSLTRHIEPLHNLTVDQYRERHGLGAEVAMVAEDIRTSARARFERMRSEHPGFRANAEGAAARLAESRPRAIAASRASARQPERLAALRESVAHAVRERIRQAREKHDASARAAGYADLPDLLHRTVELRERDLAPLLGVSPGTVGRLRREHGVVLPPRRQAGARRGPARRPRAAELPSNPPNVPPGVQPEQDGQIQCLECGRWFAGLSGHLGRAHGITAEEYRAAHELMVNQSLVGADLRERFAERERARMAADPEAWERFVSKTPEQRAEYLRQARERMQEVKGRAGLKAVGRSLTAHAAQVRSDQIRERNDALAREHGYVDMAALLSGTVTMTAPALGEMLGLTKSQVTELRRRHGIASLGRVTAEAARRQSRSAP